MLRVLLGASAHLHDTGAAHPESRARVEQVVRSLDGAGYAVERCTREATRADLLTIHAPAYVDHILSLRGQVVALDPETHLGHESVQAALNAAGTALELADALAAGRDSRIFAVVRPPGHHAARASTSGYCLFNNVALAAERLCRQGLRVCILDWDIHHGNGTEDIFFTRPDVLFISVHSNHLFPLGTGNADTVGEGEGRHTTVNIPLPAGAKLAAYAHATTSVILPVVRRYRPDVVLASMGFDARVGDPQGNFRLETEDFGYLGAVITAAAAECTGHRIGIVLEGGYNPPVLGACVLSALAGLDLPLDRWSPGEPTPQERAAVETCARIHGLR